MRGQLASVTSERSGRSRYSVCEVPSTLFWRRSVAPFGKVAPFGGGGRRGAGLWRLLLTLQQQPPQTDLPRHPARICGD